MSTTEGLTLTDVELKALESSPFKAHYPPLEKFPAIVVDNFPALGRLAAMRFLEWAQSNPGGVISLPTGKTPEHFIYWVSRMLGAWKDPVSADLLERNGVDPSRGKPDMASLHFVQIDEFYPMNASQANSFHHYVNRFYIKGFGLDPKKALLMDGGRIGLTDSQRIDDVWPGGLCDLSLRTRQARTQLERTQRDAIARVDQWCEEYESRIRALGGIGFFLGGVGPDGHIAFNVRGSGHHTVTRLTETNYETQAAAAGDLGGIEVSRTRKVITIGMGTIAFNPNVTALIIAAGEAKAEVVADAIQRDKNVLYPATALHGLPNARFYLTKGAAKGLEERRFAALRSTANMSEDMVEQALVDLCVAKRKRLLDLTADDVASDRFAATTLKSWGGSLASVASMVHARLISKINEGAKTRESARFLHTEPHHDDVMLGYMPAVIRNIRDASNEHFFATLTSGFTAVTNTLMRERLERVLVLLDAPGGCELNGHGSRNPKAQRNADVWHYLDGVAADDQAVMHAAETRRDLRNLMEVFNADSPASVRAHVTRLQTYFGQAYPGQKDPEDIQRLKGMLREWEAETLWGYFGWKGDHVFHLRLGFYTGNIFTEEPTVERDVPPVVDLLRDTAPDIITLALDPEASGPDTHYKVMQAIAAALKQYSDRSRVKDLTIWGYRNVWYRFQSSEANLFVPVSLNTLAVMETSFLRTFVSQKSASFPSFEHDGPFCELARNIQVRQYETLRTCLGEEWFHEHQSPLIRAARGFVFLKQMKLNDFYKFCRELKQSTEDTAGAWNATSPAAKVVKPARESGRAQRAGRR